MGERLSDSGALRLAGIQERMKLDGCPLGLRPS